MQFLKHIQLIQGGMGVYVSNWRLARAVAMERPGITAGTVSGTALDIVYARLLQLGDPGGHIRRAYTAFDTRFGTQIGQRLLDQDYREGGKPPADRFRITPMHTARPAGGKAALVLPEDTDSVVELSLDSEVIERIIISTFAEVWLARQGHSGRIFINFLSKVELPLIYAMYGAMLAGVDAIVVGAGNPEGLPAACAALAEHAPVTHQIPVLYRESGESFILPFDPRQVADGRLAQAPLPRPAFLAIVSLESLVVALAQSQSGAPDGFIIEHHTAGGHNAGPQGPLQLDALGQPLYSTQDEPNLDVIRGVGLPFWLAGGYGSHEKLQHARTLGAAGIQAGTVFALAEESGMKPAYRNEILNRIKHSSSDEQLVQTTLFSPTGYPFKVVQLPGTLSEEAVFSARRRVCDIGLLQQRGLAKPDSEGMRQFFQRCPAAPAEDYIRKRGLPRNMEGKRCLCNGLLACVGLGQVGVSAANGDPLRVEEPAIITLGNHLDGVRRVSRSGQTPYWARDAVADILGD